MFKAQYYKTDGSKGRARPLPESLFDGTVNESALHRAVKAYLANQRQGTAAAKNRSAVAGGSRKPWRQKGTGRARAGTTRAAQWTGGGMAFPPQPHSWRQKLPKKLRALARRSALNARAGEDRVVLVDAFKWDAPKTSQMVAYLGHLEAEGKVLVLTDGNKPNVYLSSRNLQAVRVLPFGEESAYDVLWAGTVLIERDAIDNLDAEPAPKKAAKAAPAEEATEDTSGEEE